MLTYEHHVRSDSKLRCRLRAYTGATAVPHQEEEADEQARSRGRSFFFLCVAALQYSCCCLANVAASYRKFSGVILIWDRTGCDGFMREHMLVSHNLLQTVTAMATRMLDKHMV